MRFEIRSPAHRPFDEGPGTLKLAEAARRAFLRSGGVGFGVRSVAKEAGMSVGAVQHYYPTRDKLLMAMLEYVISQYESASERLFEELPFNAEARLLGGLDYLAADSCNPQSRQFFFALFSLSTHNRFAATLLDEIYLRHRRKLATLIGAARPALSEKRCFEAATQIVGLLEGLAVFSGAHMKHAVDRRGMVRLVRAAAARLLSDGGEELLAGTERGMPRRARGRVGGAALKQGKRD